MVVGVRPQKLSLGKPESAESDGGLRGELLVHEFLGKEGIAQVAVKSKMMECVTDPEIPFKKGDRVSLKAAFEDLHFFDPQTTNRIVKQVE